MKTSARNQLAGTVKSIKHGAIDDEILLALPGGQTIAAVITQQSTALLGLAEGVAAFALVKASSVLILAGNGACDGALKISARNQLRGTVSKLMRGAVNAEVPLVLGGGTEVTAVITNESVDALALDIGVEAVGAFKASSVIIAVEG
jgi:molybdate transport system regulatory protein